MNLFQNIKSHLSTLFAGTAACSLLFSTTPVSADASQDATLAQSTDALDAAATPLRARTDTTRIVTPTEHANRGDTGNTRPIGRHGMDDDTTATPAKPQRPVSRVMHRMETTSTDSGATLLFSDSPEYATEDGILYQDTVRGAARVLYYHVNRMKAPKKVAVVLENVGGGTSLVTIARGGASQPSPNYLDVGKGTQALYFDAQGTQRFFLKAGERRVLVEDMDKTILRPEDLVYGCYDFLSSQPVRASVVICPATTDPADFVRRARVLPADELRLRGTFANADRTIRPKATYNPADGKIQYFLLADNETDKYRTGVDATDGSAVLNYGNSGILYHVQVPLAGMEKTQCYLSPFGGTYAGALRVKTAVGLSRLILTPYGMTFFGAGSDHMTETASITKARESGLAMLTDSMELSDIGQYNARTAPTFEFSPPGASNLPVAILLMPAE